MLLIFIFYLPNPDVSVVLEVNERQQLEEGRINNYNIICETHTVSSSCSRAAWSLFFRHNKSEIIQLNLAQWGRSLQHQLTCDTDDDWDRCSVVSVAAPWTTDSLRAAFIHWLVSLFESLFTISLELEVTFGQISMSSLYSFYNSGPLKPFDSTAVRQTTSKPTDAGSFSRTRCSVRCSELWRHLLGERSKKRATDESFSAPARNPIRFGLFD